VILYGIASAVSGDAEDFYLSREEAEAVLAAILRDEPDFEASYGSRRSSSSRLSTEAGGRSAMWGRGLTFALGFALVVVGCGGKSQHHYSLNDLRPLATVPPPGWAPHPTYSGWLTRCRLRGTRLRPIEKALAQRLLAAGPVGCGGATWQDFHGEKTATASASLFKSASGAHAAMSAFRTFYKHCCAIEGAIKKDPIESLAEESFATERALPAPYAESITYMWRRGNVAIQVHIDCSFRCPGDIGRAAHAWASAIDDAVSEGLKDG
jgi:hypothetical protein